MVMATGNISGADRNNIINLPPHSTSSPDVVKPFKMYDGQDLHTPNHIVRGSDYDWDSTFEAIGV